MLSTTNFSSYDLSGYLTLGSPVIREMGKKKYMIQKYQGEHAEEYTVYEVDGEGKSNGFAQLFKKGLIQLSWKEKDGKREGIVTLYENGVAKRKTNWNNLTKLSNGRTWDSAEVVVVNEDSFRGRSSSGEVFAEKICDANGNCFLVERDEIDTILYKGEGNDEMQKEGWGMQYHQSGVERHFGYYHRNRLVHIHQEFLKDNSGNLVMIEYRKDENDKNVLNCLKRYPIYVGEYEYDCKKGLYLRHGEGYQINESLGICDFKGKWSHGNLIETICEYVNGGVSGMKADPSIREYAIDWNEELPICAELNLTKPRGIEELIVGEGLYNDDCGDISKMKVDLSEFKKLKRIEIGNQCFRNVREFVVDGLDSLENVKIGEKCFRPKALDDMSDEDILSFIPTNGVCRITNCPNLRQLEIGDASFADFKSFELSNLNSIQSIKFLGIVFTMLIVR